MSWTPSGTGVVTALAVATLVLFPPSGPGAAEAQLLLTDSSRHLTLTLGTWIQPRYEYLDPASGERLSSFHLRRARLDVGGTAFAPRLGYRIQAEVARTAHLMDAYLEWTFSPGAGLRFGQSPVPFHFLVSPRRKQMPESSLGFHTPGIRNTGVSLSGRPAEGRWSYHVGIYDGAPISARRSDSDGHMISLRGSRALSGRVPTEEADPFREARGVLAVGAGLQAANRNELEDWSLGRSTSRRGDWATAVGDVQLQHRGLTVLGEYFHRWVEPGDVGLTAYQQSAWSLSLGYTLAQDLLPPVEVAVRRSSRTLDRDPPSPGSIVGGESLTDAAVTLYHQGHNLKTMLGFSHRVADIPGAASRVALTVDTHLIF